MKTETIKRIYVGLIRVCKNVDSNQMWLEYDAGDGDWLEIELEQFDDVLESSDTEPTLLLTSIARMMQE